MPKSDLLRRIDAKPTNTHGAGGVFVTPSTSTPPPSVITGEMFVGRREGPRAGLFRLPDNKIMLEVADTANVPILSAGARDYAPNTTFLSIGYANQPGIRLPWSSAAPGEPEQHRGLEVDAECLVGMLPPDILPLSFVSSSMIDWGFGAGQVSAADVPIADAGGYYSGEDVEAVLQEIGADLATLAAENVSISDAGGYYASIEVEGALQELGGGMAYILANWPA